MRNLASGEEFPFGVPFFAIIEGAFVSSSSVEGAEDNEDKEESDVDIVVVRGLEEGSRSRIESKRKWE